MSTMPLKVNAQQLEDILQAAQLPLLIWLSPDGSSPPSDVSKALATASIGYEGRLQVILVNQSSVELLDRFNLGKRPVLVGWHNGTEVLRRQRPWAADVPPLVQQLANLIKQPSAVAETNGNPKGYPMNPVHVTDQTFESEVLKSELPVLIDFWAEWCGPCRMVAPILDKLAVEYAGKVKIAKVDVDANPGLSQAFRIMSIPTMMFVKEGKIVGQQAGALPEAVLRDALEQLMALQLPA